MPSADEARSASAPRALERAADRDARLAAYRPAAVVDRPSAKPLDPGDASVGAYAATLSGLSAEQAATRLEVLAEFCAFVGETPAQMTAGIFDREAYRYVRRSHYEQRILDFSVTAGSTWAERTAAGDVIRGFFLANGHRIAPAMPVEHLWMRMG